MQIAQLNDHLFLSSARAVIKERMRTLGITNIVNCTAELPAFSLHNIKCLQIHVWDTPSEALETHFDTCADEIHKIHKRGGKTLVHCVAGISRSPSICMAYLMKYERLTLEQTYHHIKNIRPVIHPNEGFWCQLIKYERRLFGRNTVKMISLGSRSMPDVYSKKMR